MLKICHIVKMKRRKHHFSCGLHNSFQSWWASATCQKSFLRFNQPLHKNTQRDKLDSKSSQLFSKDFFAIFQNLKSESSIFVLPKPPPLSDWCMFSTTNWVLTNSAEWLYFKKVISVWSWTKTTYVHLWKPASYDNFMWTFHFKDISMRLSTSMRLVAAFSSTSSFSAGAPTFSFSSIVLLLHLDLHGQTVRPTARATLE